MDTCIGINLGVVVRDEPARDLFESTYHGEDWRLALCRTVNPPN